MILFRNPRRSKQDHILERKWISTNSCWDENGRVDHEAKWGTKDSSMVDVADALDKFGSTESSGVLLEASHSSSK
jgi:hypothetical protein